MPEYLSPGVYVEEVDTGPKPISPVATSTAGMVGVTRRGPESPVLLTNYGDFVRTFGAPVDIPPLATRQQWGNQGHWWHAAESVKGFFDEGGTRVYFQRVTSGDAAPSDASYDGGLVTGLETDIEPAGDPVRLRHTVGIAAGATLNALSEDGTALGTIDITAVDHTARTIEYTFGAGGPFTARSGRDLLIINAVNAALDVLDVEAASVGEWGDALSVQIVPTIGARLELAPTPTSGAPVVTATTAAAAVGDVSINVTPVAGSLDAATAVPFQVSINGGAPVDVTAVADAAPDLTLTMAALTAAVPAGTEVRVIRPAVNGTTVTVRGAGRLYTGAMVQLHGPASANVRRVVSVTGTQVEINAAPGAAFVEGDALTLLEAEVVVREATADGIEERERFTGLRLTDTDRFDELIGGINQRSAFIRLTAGADYDATQLANFPAISTGAWAQLTNGDNALGTLRVADFVGVNLGPGQRTGIQALEDIDQVAVCAVPGMWHADVRNALITHCEILQDRFAILDPPPGLSVQEVEAFRSPIDTKYAALYYPWLSVADPRPAGTGLTVPPSAFMAGIYARTDIRRGVHKAPANETIRSIRGLAQSITKREQDILNPQNINVLRAFPGRGNRVWGARVLTSDSAWKYVNVRRLFIMIEESIDEATQWVVFEPNDEPTWSRVRQSVSAFLTTQWRIGALQGTKAEQAFYVACDYSTMTQDDIDNGRLICEIGIAPVKPAEFVIFRIQQKTLELTSA